MDNIKWKWFKLAFFVSLGLNLCFISSYMVIFSKLNRLKAPEGRLELVAKRLNLTGVQKEKVAILAMEMREHRKVVKQNHAAEIAEFRSELVKENPDYNKISQLMGVAVEERSKTLALLSEKIQEFLKVLTPKQRQDIMRRLDKVNRFIGE